MLMSGGLAPGRGGRGIDQLQLGTGRPAPSDQQDA